VRGAAPPGLAGAGTPPAGGFGGPGGGPGGAARGAQTAAVAYARVHGGGTVASSSQNSTSAQVIAGDDVAAIGGFSGRESEVSATWLADAIDGGQIRWVLADGGGGGAPNDTRVGSRSVMTLVAQTCSKTGSSGLYDCAGKASALRAAAKAS
jgi:hypothetical protein